MYFTYNVKMTSISANIDRTRTRMTVPHCQIPLDCCTVQRAGRQVRSTMDDRRYMTIDRDKEVSNVSVWSRANNLTLNQAKSVEVIFCDNQKRQCIHPTSPLQVFVQVKSLKVLSVTLITDRLSVTEHVNGIDSSCEQSMYAISVLWSHGME